MKGLDHGGDDMVTDEVEAGVDLGVEAEPESLEEAVPRRARRC